jgi:acyl-coenzyme A thioesterase PaaI-like protein
LVELRAGYCEATVRKHRAVHNHIGTVHAIAICNLAELTAGLVTDVTIPATHRWIPKGMSVQYLKRAATNLRAVATVDTHADLTAPASLPVRVEVTDTAGTVVVTAEIAMWITTRNVT